MIKVMCSIYDDKAQFYAAPFCVNTEPEAVRLFGMACNDSQTPFSQFPSDVSLYVIGKFNDNSGEFIPEVPRFLSRGNEHVKVVSRDA